MKIHEDIERVLISEEQLQKRIKELAAQINKDYEGEIVEVVTVLKGGVMFSVDLMRALELPVEIDFMSASSYSGATTTSSGSVKIEKDLKSSIEGKNVLIVEDIIDSGTTLKYLTEMLRMRKPKSLEICTILDKPSRRKVDVDVKYVGFEIPDEFVVGYGLDYDEKHRNLPYVGILKRSVYEK